MKICLTEPSHCFESIQHFPDAQERILRDDALVASMQAPKNTSPSPLGTLFSQDSNMIPGLQRDLFSIISRYLPTQNIACLRQVNKRAKGLVDGMFKPDLPKIRRIQQALKGIPVDQIPANLQECSNTLLTGNRLGIESVLEQFLKARDTLIIWQKVAEQAKIEGGPNFAELETVHAFIHKAAEFKEWLEEHPSTKSIYTLNLSSCSLTSIPEELALLESLTNLDISQNQIQDISTLSGLVNLRNLHLNQNQIQDVSPISNLVSLEDLSLGQNQIQDVSSLSSLEALKWLYLEVNQISDVSSLSKLVSLEALDLNQNQLQDMSSLSNLVNLEYLCLGQNQIQDVSSLSSLEALKWLYLEANQISDVSSLSNLVNLEELNLSQNQIQILSPLSGLKKLEELELHHNQIQDVSPLSSLTKLKFLDLSKNQVSDVSSLSSLKNLKDPIKI